MLEFSFHVFLAVCLIFGLYNLPKLFNSKPIKERSKDFEYSAEKKYKKINDSYIKNVFDGIENKLINADVVQLKIVEEINDIEKEIRDNDKLVKLLTDFHSDEVMPFEIDSNKRKDVLYGKDIDISVIQKEDEQDSCKKGLGIEKIIKMVLLLKDFDWGNKEFERFKVEDIEDVSSALLKGVTITYLDEKNIPILEIEKRELGCLTIYDLRDLRLFYEMNDEYTKITENNNGNIRVFSLDKKTCTFIEKNRNKELLLR